MQVAQARVLLEDLKKRTMEEENNPYDCSWDAAAEILLVSLQIVDGIDNEVITLVYDMVIWLFVGPITVCKNRSGWTDT